MLNIPIAELAAAVTGRSNSFFESDILKFENELRNKLEGKRILVIGGAGSIGSQTIKCIIPFKPGTLHIVDVNENGLAELIRDLRNSRTPPEVDDLLLLPMNFGSNLMLQMIAANPPYDFVLNFAAVKHVRSEKDCLAILHMLDTNVVKSAALIEALGQKNPSTDYFSVSTDKAAFPVNFMGASKRLMEHVIFSDEAYQNPLHRVSSARFANVAFSNGSLLESFLIRLRKGQPLSCPSSTKRFFVSPNESGQICVLTSILGLNDRISIPDFDETEYLIDLEHVARTILLSHGLEPVVFEDSSEAISSATSLLASNKYPLIITPLNTSGEKAYEEFVGEGESKERTNFDTLAAVKYSPLASVGVRDLLNKMENWLSATDETVDQSKVHELIASAIPEFEHHQSEHSLDDRT